MSQKPTLRELIDACRADHHDPQRTELPELAPLARELAVNAQLQQTIERSERLDRSVRAALDDVELPAGLAERLLIGCEAAKVTPAATAEAEKKGWSRRQVIALFSAAASLLIVIVGASQLPPWFRPRPISNELIASNAVQWFDESGPAAKWSTIESAPTKEFPLDSMMYAPVRWRQVNLTTVVYEMRLRDQRALLFVSKKTRPHPGLATSPYTTLTSSGGLVIGAWQRNNVVYVIAAPDGNGRRSIEVFVRRPKLT